MLKRMMKALLVTLVFSLTVASVALAEGNQPEPPIVPTEFPIDDEGR